MPTKWTREWKIPLEDIPVICALYENNFSLNSIARQYKVDHSSIIYQLKKAGVYKTHRNGNKIGRSIDNLERERIVKELKDPNSFIYKNAWEIKKRARNPRYLYNDGEKDFPKSYEEYGRKQGVKIPPFMQRVNMQNNESRRRCKGKASRQELEDELPL